MQRIATDASTMQKAWVAAHLRGAMNYLLPSFREDGHSLGEAGIAMDVDATVAHGFFGTMPVTWFRPDDPRPPVPVRGVCRQDPGHAPAGDAVRLDDRVERLR